MKKHFSQMTPQERTYLVNRFKSIPPQKWKFTNYSRKRLAERGVDFSVIATFWKEDFDLIEFHKHEDGSNRILLRSIMVDSNNNQVCAVFNLSTYEIVTLYLNYKKNKHSNLDWSQYCEGINIKAAMKV